MRRLWKAGANQWKSPSSRPGSPGIRRGRAGVASQPRKFRVIKNVESLGPEFQFAALPYLEMFEQRYVEVRSSRIIEEVPAGIAESKSARSHKLIGIADEWAKAFAVVERRLRSFNNVGVGSRNAVPTVHSGIVSQ